MVSKKDIGACITLSMACLCNFFEAKKLKKANMLPVRKKHAACAKPSPAYMPICYTSISLAQLHITLVLLLTYAP